MPIRSSLVCASAALSCASLVSFALVSGCSSSNSGTASDAGGESDASSPVIDAGPDGTTSDPNDASTDTGTVSEPDAPTGTVDSGPPPTYLNPVLNQDFPDPFILRQGSKYYAFGTNGGTPAANVQTASSTDLAHWTVLSDALPTLPTWAAPNASLTWAPSILQLGPTSFVMYYVTRDKASGFQCISRAVSTTPAGPYTDTSSSAFVCQVAPQTPTCGSIDPSPFVDSNGALYLVWKSDENASACNAPPRLWSAPLSADGLTTTASPTQLLIKDQAWQGAVIEGPSMKLVNGLYYLLYSANNYASASYAMGYATCLSPTGPCENVSTAAPFIASAGAALGPGGGEFFADADGGSWLVYHAWTAPDTTYPGGQRSMRVDPIAVVDGGLSFKGPTTSIQTF